ncbi:MAG: (2Fe-2S) ferredoxin domain-containing protein [Deltaproteobacteria bacterium]|jgi:(2Fe-2S) ferredoxin
MKDIKSQAQDCKVQVLVCTNERPGGKSCCHKFGGQEFYLALKNRLKQEGLYDTHWVTRTGCLGFCNDVGTAVAIYRQNEPTQWFNEVTAEDMDSLWKEIVRE